jgi:large subunit ribosomal protein L22
VKTALANEGPRMKRIRPAPMGRAFRYQRRLGAHRDSVAERKSAGLVETVGEPETAAPAKKRVVLARRPRAWPSKNWNKKRGKKFAQASKRFA